MEDKLTTKPESGLTTEQSLDLIARMLENTRRNFSRGVGAMFLIWGYTTIAVTVAVTILFRLTQNYDTMFLWWAVSIVWIVFSGVVACCMIYILIVSLMDGKQPFNPMFTIGLTMSMSLAIIPTWDNNILQMPLFAIMVLMAQVIPGHLLNRTCKRESGRTENAESAASHPGVRRRLPGMSRR